MSLVTERFAGSPGSCLPAFSAMPFLFCDGNGDECHYATRGDRSYWLRTTRAWPSDRRSLSPERLRPFVSRCAICETRYEVCAAELFE